MKWIYQLNHVVVSHGDRVILGDVTVSVRTGAKIGVLGPNGSGKSTLLAVMAGVAEPSAGSATSAPSISIGILPQEPHLRGGPTVLANIEQSVAGTRTLMARFIELTERLAEGTDGKALDELGAVQEALDQANAWDLGARLEQAMNALRCPPSEAEIASLSGGERRRVALCAVLLRQPDLLLLDEPTAHLDAESVQWLEQHLKQYQGTVVAVTHDRYFLDNVAQVILELDRGRVYPYEGSYSTYLEKKQAQVVIEGRKDAKRKQRLARELAWIHSPPGAKQASGRARLRRYENMFAAAANRRRLDWDEIPIPPGPRLGSLVINAEDLTKSFGDRVLFDDVSFSVPPNSIVGVIGPNGVGKTTLLRMIVGEESPDSGALRVGDTVRLSYVDQDRARLDPNCTAWELLSDGHDLLTADSSEAPSRAFLAAFGFKGADQQKPARRFSGGERSRLNLALTLMQGGNVLLLDEAANDLDVETMSKVEDALLTFPGCALVITHDRWFLDRVATHVLAWEGTERHPGRWFWFEGNYADYENNKISRLGPEAARPHRLVHRKITRD